MARVATAECRRLTRSIEAHRVPSSAMASAALSATPRQPVAANERAE
jgi:hypothetical protein